MKRYTLEMIEREEGVAVNCVNGGFNTFEVLGLMYFKLEDIRRQMAGEIAPDKVTRKIGVEK